MSGRSLPIPMGITDNLFFSWVSSNFAFTAIRKTLALILLVHLTAGLALAGTEDISKHLREVLEAAPGPHKFWIGCEPIHSGKELVGFYGRRGYQPIWVSKSGPSDAARELIAALGKAEKHGLSSHDYHYPCLWEWLKAFSSNSATLPIDKELAGMELLLSDGFITFGSHLSTGKVDPVTISPTWVTKKKKTEVFDYLLDIQRPQDVRAAFEALAPSCHGYLSAMNEVRRLREIIARGGWPVIPPGKTLRKGDRSPRVALLRKRFFLEGDLLNAGDAEDRALLFDRNLEKAVTQFQNRRGLAPDGAFGRNTLAAINRSPEDLLRTVVVNMERWRWLPRDLGRRRIVINVAAFTLEAFWEGYPMLEMPVIVGEAYTMTPVFSKNMAYLVINPYWNVPPGILERKILPEIKKNPNYLTANHYELVAGWKDTATLLNPATVKWSRVHAGNFPGRLRQKPGPWNALGRIKFIFPNQFDVYLHDTPQRHLFKRRIRAFSSGCIRVQDPVDLALYVLENDPSWNRTRLEETIAGGKTTVIPVKDTVTVHLFYWTFWADEEGKAHYAEDIYGRDRGLWEALHSAPGMTLPSPITPIPAERDRTWTRDSEGRSNKKRKEARQVL